MGQGTTPADHATRQIALEPTDNKTEAEERETDQWFFQDRQAEGREGSRTDDGMSNEADNH